MGNINRQIIVFSIIVTVLCFAAIIIFTLPAFIKQIDLSDKNNIGSTLGGITAPIIGIITSILLYLALTRQTQSNIQQRLKNESDIIFLLFNQLDTEISAFYYKYNKGNEIFHIRGIEGINTYCNEFRYEFALGTFNFQFKHFYEANQIILLIRSYKLIDKRIEIADLAPEMKDLFSSKLNGFFDCRFKIPFRQLSEAFEMQPILKDEVTNEIQEFVYKQSS